MGKLRLREVKESARELCSAQLLNQRDIGVKIFFLAN